MAVGSIGKYERLDVLGHGASGVVYLAWDTLLRRNVALKEIRADGAETERIVEEARLLDKLRGHPNIVEVHSVDIVDGVILIDMELVRGKTLSELLKERAGKPFPVAEAVRIAVAVLEALAHAHTRRVVHRDVKPANIMVGQDGAVKLTDFGIAEALGTGSVAGGGGTYPYMAPEDFSSEADSDYRSDLWAVGVLLYEMLVGKRPFSVDRKKDPFAWQRVIQNETPVRVGSLVPGIPVALDVVIEKALSKNKADRYPTAQVFAAALQAVPLPNVISVSAPQTRDDSVNTGHPQFSDVPYLSFAHGLVVAYSLDEVRTAAAKHWDEGRAALMDGRIERFLREVGEIYIADLAAELTARPNASPDRLLFEFLERSAPMEAEEHTRAASFLPGEFPKENRALRDMGTPANGTTSPVRETLPLFQTTIKARSNRTANPQEVASRTAPGKGQPSEPQKGGLGLAPPPVPTVPPETVPGAKPTRDFPVEVRRAETVKPENPVAHRGSAWWFGFLLLLCLAPPATAYVASTRGSEFLLRESLAVTGLLTAMLLLVGVGARVPLFLRVICFFPMAAGVLCLGALGAVIIEHGMISTAEAPLKVASGLLAPVLLLLSEAVTLKQGWKVWAWVVCLLAGAATAYFLFRG